MLNQALSVFSFAFLSIFAVQTAQAGLLQDFKCLSLTYQHAALDMGKYREFSFEDDVYSQGSPGGPLFEEIEKDLEHRYPGFSFYHYQVRINPISMKCNQVAPFVIDCSGSEEWAYIKFQGDHEGYKLEIEVPLEESAVSLVTTPFSTDVMGYDGIRASAKISTVFHGKKLDFAWQLDFAQLQCK